MLVELRVRDYAVVEDLTLELGPGLNVLTGETGAGKSIIVGALSLLLGERASSSVVRTGAERAIVEAVFDIGALPALRARLDEHGLSHDDDLLILRREVAAAGRNRAWAGGSPTTAGVVGELGGALVDLHGQHEHQTLLRQRDQRRILDAYAGAEEVADEVARLHAEVQALLGERAERGARRRDVESRADFLRFQLAEIEAVRPAVGEDEALEAEARRHENSEELSLGAAALHETLYGGDDSISDRLAAARQALERLAAFDAELGADVDLLAEAFHVVTDVGSRVGGYASAVDHDPERLEQVRERLDKLLRLKRKYGPGLVDVLGVAEQVRADLAGLDDADHDLGRIEARLADQREVFESSAGRLTELRRSAAAGLGAAVAAALPALGLPGAAFEVRLAPHEAVGAGGAESVEFLVSPNQGFEPMALSKIASGGELSRVMLALKSILATVDRVPVLVFDEIDAGVGGVVGGAVAEKLAEVASRHQVLVVTHLAQVASRADTHLMVEKGAGDGITTASVRTLSGEARVEEIARMLGGDPESKTSREHARELLATASG
jgi:DNA repair protein RecN (Recombination protein N)